MLVIPVAATPTGGRSFAVKAGRHEHRPQIFLALPHRSFRDWRNGKCRDHALPLPFFNRKRADETTAATARTIAGLGARAQREESARSTADPSAARQSAPVPR